MTNETFDRVARLIELKNKRIKSFKEREAEARAIIEQAVNDVLPSDLLTERDGEWLDRARKWLKEDRNDVDVGLAVRASKLIVKQ